MKYPLDNQGIEEIAHDVILHHRAQNQVIGKLIEILADAMAEGDPDSEWYDDAQKLVKEHRQRQIDFDNHRFNQKNGHFVGERSPYAADPSERIATAPFTDEVNIVESSGEMSADEVAQIFQEKEPKKIKLKKKKEKKLNKMTIEEIESWERAQDNSNDIYKVAARVKNAARMAVKGNLTAQGDMVCNTFTHLIKAFYDFAETVPDKETKVRLSQLVKKQEEAPANLICALTAGVKAPK